MSRAPEPDPPSARRLQRAIDRLGDGRGLDRRPNPPPFNDAFWRWFRGSKAVAPDGSPRVLYHGTRSPLDFVEFATGHAIGDDDEVVIRASGDAGAHLGPHFAEEPWVASKFAVGQAAEWDRRRYVDESASGHGGRVIPVFVSARKVMRFDSDEAMRRWIFEHGRSGALDDEIFQMVEDGAIETDRDDDGEPIVGDDVLMDYDNRMRALGRLQQYDNDGDGEGDFAESAFAEVGESAKQELLRLGYDAVRYRNDIEGGWSWVALKSGMVKSAVSNSGRWSRDSNSIFD